MSADRNLLFGILALQMDFLTRDQLVAGMQAWVLDKPTPLAEHLQRLKAMSAEQRQVLEPLVAMHIRQHGDDPQQSLAALSSAERLRGELEGIQDADVQRSLVSLGQVQSEAGPASDLMLTTTISLGEKTSAGTRFRILRPHARGGLGEVFVARDTQLGREVALKEIQHGKSDDPDARARFTREAEITGGLEHPGIVPVYGLGAYPDGRPFYAMRFIRGKSLHDAIKAYHARENASQTEKNLELRRLLQRFIDVCEAIDYAHSRGILHRDLKPGNIMLGRYGETLVVDWGLAKAVGRVSNPSAPFSDESSDISPSQLPEPPLVPGSHGSSEATQLGSALGTIAYMSPEQANGRWDLLGPTSDVFSLGATLFHLLTGRPPYTGKPDEAYACAKAGEYPRPRSLTRSIPTPLEAICLKALARQPEARYATAQALAQDNLADEPIQALPDNFLSQVNRWTRHHRHWMQAGSVALLLVAVTAISAYFYQRETALQNQKLADEKGKLATEKGKLASDKTKLADEANAKAEALRAALAHNYFAHGVSEYSAGRVHQGILDQYRAFAMLPLTDPLRPHYEHVWINQAWQGGTYLSPQHDGFAMTLALRAFSPHGDRVLARSHDGTVRLWDARTGAAVGERMRHDGIEVIVGKFSPQGDRVLTGSYDGTARLWDARTGAPLGKPMPHYGHGVNLVMAFDPRGHRIVTSGTDNNARLWDARTGVLLGEPLRHQGEVRAVAFSPQGDRVLTGSADNTARLWDAQTGAPMGDPLRHDGRVLAVAFSPHGDRVLTGSLDKTARLWDARTGVPLGEPLRQDDWVHVVAFSPQGDRILTGSAAGTACVWDSRTGAPLGQPLPHPDWVLAGAFSPQGDRIVTGSGDGTSRLWDARTGAPLREPMRHGADPYVVEFSPQGDQVLTGNGRWMEELWDGRKDASLGEPMRHDGYVEAVVFSSDGNRALVGSHGAVRLWDAWTGASIGDPMLHKYSVGTVTFNQKGDRVLTTSGDRTARLWDAQTGAPLGKPMQEEYQVSAITFDSQGDRILTVNANWTARFWDAQTGEPVGQPIQHEGIARLSGGQTGTVAGVVAAAFSPQGDRVLTSGTGNVVAQLWDPRTGAPLGEPLRHEGVVTTLVFSPDGNRVLTGSNDGTSRVWDARTGAPLGEPLRHQAEVRAVAFSPDGSRVLTRCSDNTARVWDARTGAPLGEPLRHQAEVHAMAFSPDGNRVLTACEDKTARIWDARTGAPLGEPLRHDDKVLAVAFSPQGDRVLTGSKDKTARLWDVSVLLPKNVLEYASLVTGLEVDRDGNTRELKAEEYEKRRNQFYADETEWVAAMEKRAEERRRRFLVQHLKKALEGSDLFVAYQSARWLPTEALAKIEAKSLKTPAMQVLVGWYRDGKLDSVAGALVESEEVPGSGAGQVLAVLQEAIPVLYWETDERLRGLRKALGGESGAM